jgi:hypothetical protein
MVVPLFWLTYSQLLLRAPDSASSNPSISHGKETPDDDSESFYVAQ